MTKQDRESVTTQGGPAGDASPGSPAPGDLGANTAIGRRLKAFYDDVASEPVPDRFLSLLEALDRAELARGPAGGEQESA